MSDGVCNATASSGQQSIAPQDTVTIVTAPDGQHLTKRWSGPGGAIVEPAADVGLFRYQSVRIAGLGDLRNLLEQVAKYPRCAIIRGDLKPGLDLSMLHPRRSRDAKGPATVDDVPRRWVGVDMDDLQVAPWLSGAQIAAYAQGLLPYPFSAAPCVWQLSASTGSAKKRGAGTAGVHLWFWLEEPRTSVDLRTFFRPYLSVDGSLFKAVGLHFCADPIIGPECGPDPFAGDRLGMLAGFAPCSVPEAPPGIGPSTVGMKGGGDPVEIARFIDVVERSGALRSQSVTKTADRSVRIAFLDALNEMGWTGTDDELRDVFFRCCVGDGDEDGENDFLEAVNWMEMPSGGNRVLAGSIIQEAERAAREQGRPELLAALHTLKGGHVQGNAPKPSEMMAAAAAAGHTATGVSSGTQSFGDWITSDPQPGELGAPQPGGASALMAALAAQGGAAGASAADTPEESLTSDEDQARFARIKARAAARAELVGGQTLTYPSGLTLVAEATGNIMHKDPFNVSFMLEYRNDDVRFNAWLGKDQISRAGEPWAPFEDKRDWSTIYAECHAVDYPITMHDLQQFTYAFCAAKTVDPMRAYLDGLAARDWGHDEQDGGAPALTLNSWLPQIMGVEDTPYHRAVGRYLVGSMVRRILMPGCKSDEMVVLISKEQGKGKSTFCKLLAPDIPGEEPGSAYCESLPLGSEAKVVLELTGGKAVVEFSEMAAARNREVEHIKAMLSRTHDAARMSYGREVTERGRRFIFVGTTNDETPLRDEGGNRRFLPVKMPVGVEIDLERFRKAKERLLGLAVRELMASGWTETFRLPRELWEVAAQMQEQARGYSVGEELLRAHLGTEAEHGIEWISSKDLTEWKAKHGKMTMEAFSAAMRRLGFEQAVVRLPNGGKLERRWQRSGEGLEGSVQFTYGHERGTFTRMVLTGSSGAVATFNPTAK